jgi:general secretion pathway protein J
MSRRDAGFTLLELLVALTIFGLLMAGLAEGTRFGLAAWRAQDAGDGRQSDLEAADRVLRHLVTQAMPGRAGAPAAFDGRPGGLAWRSDLPGAGGLAPLRDVDVALGLDAGRRLVLRWTPHTLPPGQPRIAREEVVLAGLDHVEFAYWPAGPSATWLRDWHLPVLPALVRIRLVFPDGDRRHWPAIVAAPGRDPPIE